jgi:hypothetical protein
MSSKTSIATEFALFWAGSVVIFLAFPSLPDYPQALLVSFGCALCDLSGRVRCSRYGYKLGSGGLL